MKILQWSSVLALAIVLAVVACVPAQSALQLAPDATADSVVFVLTNADGTGPAQGWIYGLSVVACGTDHSLWTIATAGERSLPARITYGRPVPGFAVREGPEPLVPGCYDVYISGGRPLRFSVDNGKAVRLQSR